MKKKCNKTIHMCCANLPQFLVKCCRHLENFHLYREDPGNYAQGCSCTHTDYRWQYLAHEATWRTNRRISCNLKFER